nr:phosphonate C-P lyase system protein PhnH [uncultured Cohaesibacter sp.]
MLPIPTPDADETRANQCFEALLWALSRPGQIRSLPQAGQSQIVDALIDRECAAYSDDETLAEHISNSGAMLVSPEKADHVFLSSLTSSDILAKLKTGSDLYPDDGATLMLPASFNEGQLLRLSGPGVNGALEVRIGGLPDLFFALRNKLVRYPMGFDIFFIDGNQVIGLPRSTKLEIV